MWLISPIDLLRPGPPDQQAHPRQPTEKEEEEVRAAVRETRKETYKQDYVEPLQPRCVSVLGGQREREGLRVRAKSVQVKVHPTTLRTVELQPR